MARVTIRWGELRDSGQIAVVAAQSGRFLKEVNTQLKNGFGKERHDIAAEYAQDAVNTVKRILKEGIEGAEATSGRVQGVVYPIGPRGKSAEGYSYSFKHLAKSTRRQKRKYFGTSDRFWAYTGELASFASSSLKPPKIRYHTEVYSDTVRRQGTRETRIDFEVELTFDEMNFPFDDLVRRPLVEGEEYSGDITLEGTGAGNAMKIAALEGGNSRMPARPWVRGVSAEIGKAMFNELITNR